MKHFLHISLLCPFLVSFNLFTAFPFPCKVQVVTEFKEENKSAFMELIGKKPTLPEKNPTEWIEHIPTSEKKKARSTLASKACVNEILKATEEITRAKTPNEEDSHLLIDYLSKKLEQKEYDRKAAPEQNDINILVKEYFKEKTSDKQDRKVPAVSITGVLEI